MGVAVQRRNVEPAHRIDAGAAARLTRIHAKRLAGSHPTGDTAGIQSIDVRLQIADEVMIQPGVEYVIIYIAP